MAYLAAGAEFDSDEEFDDFLDDSYVRREEEVSYKKTETPKPKPKRNVVLESISCGAIFLNDIRMAIINDNFELLKELMESESNVFVDTILTAGWTALMYASNSGHKLMVHYLLERGADPNFHKDNWTPLMAVCGASNSIPEEDLIECAKYLLKFGANVNALDNYGNSALIYAAKSGKCGLIQQLIDNKIDINRPNNDGWNALHWAVREGHGKVVARLLTSDDIDITLKTKSLQTAEQIAETQSHYEINTILKNIHKIVNESSDCLDSETNTYNRKLREEDVKVLEEYVKPIVEIKCREKSKSKPKAINRDLEDFLMNSDLMDLLPQFIEKNIGYQDLVTNAEEVLDKIGVTDHAVRRRICANIVLLHNQDWKKESLKEMNLQTSITCPELLCIVSNVTNHLHRIDQTVAYLKNTVKQKPDILNLNTEQSTKRNVTNELLQALSNCRMLHQEIQSLQSVVNSIDDNSEPQTPDVLSIPFTLEDEINSKCKESANYSKSLLFSLIVVGALTVCAIKVGPNQRENALNFMFNTFSRIKFS